METGVLGDVTLLGIMDLHHDGLYRIAHVKLDWGSKIKCSKEIPCLSLCKVYGFYMSKTEHIGDAGNTRRASYGRYSCLRLKGCCKDTSQESLLGSIGSDTNATVNIHPDPEEAEGRLET